MKPALLDHRTLWRSSATLGLVLSAGGLLAYDTATALALVTAALAAHVCSTEVLVVLLAALIALLPEAGRAWSPSWIVHAFLPLIALGLQALTAPPPRIPVGGHRPFFPAAVVILVLSSFWGCIQAARAGVAQPLWLGSHMLFLFPVAAALATSRLATERRLRRFVDTLLLAAGINTLYALCQVSGGFQVVARINNTLLVPLGQSPFDLATLNKIWWGLPKAFGTFYGPSGLGGLLVLALALGAARLIHKPTLWHGILFLVLYTGLILTFSRAALLGFGLTLALGAAYAWRTGRRRMVVPALLLILSTPVLYQFMLEHPFTDRSRPRILRQTPPQNALPPSSAAPIARPAGPSPQTIKKQTVDYRLNELLVFAQSLRSGFLGGIGYNTRFVLETGQPAPIGAFGRTVSSLYLELFYRLGLLGLAAYLTLVSAIGWRLWHRLFARRSCDQALLALGLATASVSLTSLFDHTFLSTPALAVAWAALIGFGHRLVGGEKPCA